MKYACLVYHQEGSLAECPFEEHLETVKGCIDWIDGLEKAGKHVFSSGLQSSANAVTVRERNGKIGVTDGPFAETKEVLGGFTIIEANDLNEALSIVSNFPAIRSGTVEVRPVFDPQNDMIDPLDQKLAKVLREAMGVAT